MILTYFSEILQWNKGALCLGDRYFDVSAKSYLSNYQQNWFQIIIFFETQTTMICK